jgi:Rrf2 family protein
MISMSTKGRYATRIAVNLARAPHNEAKSARIIAQEEDISADYVEQLMIKLKSAGFIKSRRGKNGGSLLNQKADTIRVADLLNAIEGKIALAPCITESCSREKKCTTHFLWKKANESLNKVFESVTIADLAEDKDSAALSFQI